MGGVDGALGCDVVQAADPPHNSNHDPHHNHNAIPGDDLEAANPLRSCLPPEARLALLDKIEARVRSCCGARSASHAKWAAAGLGRAIEAILLRPILLPTSVSCALNPLYLRLGRRTRHSLVQINEALQPLGGRAHRSAGFLVLSFSNDW